MQVKPATKFAKIFKAYADKKGIDAASIRQAARYVTCMRCVRTIPCYMSSLLFAAGSSMMVSR